MKALWNLPTTRAALSFVRNSPIMRRLCGWESIADIPHEMMQRTSERFDYFYDLAGAGYDARVIKDVSRQLGHEPIIDRNVRRGEKNAEDPGAKFVNIVPADKIRYNHRTGVERVFSHLHDAHGGKFVRVRGVKKVFLHLMFGLLHLRPQGKCAASKHHGFNADNGQTTTPSSGRR